tara:strand:- start:7386 stop:8441 length:1056 start_codon:yes stop_codon:yes gene_type:complete
MSKKLATKFWKKFLPLVEEHYKEIKQRGMSLRSSYYFLRRKLSECVGANFTQAEFDYFCKSTTYEYYSQDMWARWEEQKGWERPPAKIITILWENGKKMAADDLDVVSKRNRGFIFVEKSDIAASLMELSKYGWAVLSGQGVSQRELRAMLSEFIRKHPKYPILILHDWDTVGRNIVDNFVSGSRRTKHLGIELGENVHDLGLTKDQVKRYSLVTEPEAVRYRAKQRYRVELDALIGLPDTDKPYEWFAKQEMNRLGFKLTKRPISKRRLAQEKVGVAVQVALMPMISEATTAAVGSMNIPGNAVTASLHVHPEAFDDPVIKAQLEQLALSLAQHVEYKSEQEVHEAVLAS